ncbi:fused MFS/spermidine synthase [Novosphingobium sp.]|uniref:spermidine synthase n=1 Tax=Novosphingobium sp. TaxID=1874826 RepID=UPI00286D646C|nr:fused MFS/spermidine synthase [Novosphingobium sp.]
MNGQAAPAARGLFVATILTGSFLLFLVQPMVARMALPRLGGAPNVWNSAMLVYQALLLGGYWYAHRLSRLPLRRQARIHLAVFVLAALTLPVSLATLAPSAPGREVWWVPLLFALSIGPVFFMVSAQAPLMQRWYALHPQASAPWALYAASNLGSFGGLIAYPLLAEPLLALHWQSWAWTAGYLLLLGLIALAARARWNVGDAGNMIPQAQKNSQIPRLTVAHWIVLAAAPSGLMLATTTHLTTDVFAMPLLWVMPLGLYLLSFVIAFADRRGPARLVSALAWLGILTVGPMAAVSYGWMGIVPLICSVVLLFLLCTALHARLYELRPAPELLTAFYLAMSAGGALGGLFTALIAPLTFDWVWEYPLLVLAAAVLLPRGLLPDWRNAAGLDPALRWLALGALVMAAGILGWMLYNANLYAETRGQRWPLAAAIALVGMALVPWRSLVVAVLAGTMLAQGGWDTIDETREGIRTRSYFGIYTLREHPETRRRTLMHGTTAHGVQSTDPARKRTPLAYYGPSSGAGIVFSHPRALVCAGAHFGVLGLGAGSLACFRQSDQRLTVFEIDPAVLALSTNGTFTYLSECAPAARVVLGDARLELAREPKGSFDLLAIDAFSSDSVPMHLFTHEAFGVYLDALSPRGVMMVHISNNFIDLEPALSAELKARGLAAAVRDDNPYDTADYWATSWVAVSRDPAQIARIKALAPQYEWRAIGKPAPQVWRDDYASILPYITWKNFVGIR